MATFRLSVGQWYYRVRNWAQKEANEIMVFLITNKYKEDRQTGYNILSAIKIGMSGVIQFNKLETYWDEGFSKTKDLVKPIKETEIGKYCVKIIFEVWPEYYEEN